MCAEGLVLIKFVTLPSSANSDSKLISIKIVTTLDDLISAKSVAKMSYPLQAVFDNKFKL